MVKDPLWVYCLRLAVSLLVEVNYLVAKKKKKSQPFTHA